jgi:hypothetical protein
MSPVDLLGARPPTDISMWAVPCLPMPRRIRSRKRRAAGSSAGLADPGASGGVVEADDGDEEEDDGVADGSLSS